MSEQATGVAVRRMTPQMRQVLGVLAQSTDWFWGNDIASRTGLAGPTVTRIMGRLLDREWVEDRFEDPAEAKAEGRRPRRYYRLTEAGRLRCRVHGVEVSGAVGS